MKENSIKYLTTENLELIKINSNVDWITITSILICLMTVIGFNLINSKSTHPFYSLKSYTKKGMSSILLIINYALVVSLFIWNYINISSGKDKSLFFLLIIIISTVLIHSLKLILIYAINFIFKSKNHFHIDLHIQFYQLIGVLLLPLFILSFFTEIKNTLLIYAVTGIFIISLLIIRELKGLFTALNKGISLLYLILYLCTLELLPIVLIIKTIAD